MQVQKFPTASQFPSAAVLLQSSSQLIHLPANWSDTLSQVSDVATTSTNLSFSAAAEAEAPIGKNDTAAEALLQHMQIGNQEIDAVALALLDDVAFGNNSLAALRGSNAAKLLFDNATNGNSILAASSNNRTVRPLLATLHSMLPVFPEDLKVDRTEIAALSAPSVSPSPRAADVVPVASSVSRDRTAKELEVQTLKQYKDVKASSTSNSSVGGLGRPAGVRMPPASKLRHREDATANKTGRLPFPVQLRSYREWPSEPGARATAHSVWCRPLLLLTGAAFVIVVAYFACFGASHSGSTLRVHVEALPICTADDVERCLPSAGGYDCVLSKPMSSRMLMRLEATVEGPTSGSALTAPLMQQSCVLYWTSVTRQLHEGMQPVPVAFASSSISFTISLVDAPGVRIELRGEDVSLFDMCSGRRTETLRFADAPEHWQDFVLSHRAAGPGGDWQSSAVLRGDDASLEFQECALAVGASVTFVGELHRAAGGGLSLVPLRTDDRKPRWPAESIGWRTSWEVGADVAGMAGALTPRGEAKADARLATEKVLASDDPMLLTGKLGAVGGRFASLAQKPGWQ